MTDQPPDLPTHTDVHVTIPVEVGETLDRLCRDWHVTRDEGVRRAIALWAYLDDHQAAGGHLEAVGAEGTRYDLTLR